jgi:hypothetical protein
LENIRVREFGQYSEWLFMDAADNLFKFAKSRVFSTKRTRTTSKKSTPTKYKKGSENKHEKTEVASVSSSGVINLPSNRMRTNATLNLIKESRMKRNQIRKIFNMNQFLKKIPNGICWPKYCKKLREKITLEKVTFLL